jgi:hypothetical protein
LVKLLAAVLLLAGCASSPYRKRFHPNPAAPVKLAPCEGEPRVDAPEDPQAAGEALRKKGYETLGYSTFDSAVPNPSQDPELLKQAVRVGACRVIFSFNSSGTRRVGIGVEERDAASYDVSAIFFAKPAP